MNHDRLVRSLLLPLVLVPLAAASAQDAEAPPLGPTQVGDDRSANDLLSEERRAWLDEKGLRLGLSADRTAWIGYGQVPVMHEPGPGWGTARLGAFGRAMEEARASFVEMTGVRVAASTLSKVFSDDGALLDFSQGSSLQGEDRLKRIKAKLRTLAGPQLQEALTALGLDAADLAALSEPEKLEALEVSFTKRVATRATADLSGLRVIQTFEATRGGASAVCVLVRWSQKDMAIARLIETGVGRYETDHPGNPIEEWLSARDEDLLDDWGVRVLPGPNQEPLVVCFAQAPIEFLPQDQPMVRVTKERIAMDRARKFAQGELAFYVNASTMYDQVAERGESFEQSITKYGDGFQELDLGSSRICEQLTSTIRSEGVLHLQGGSVKREWKVRHPDTGALFCGVVYVWSPTEAELAQDFQRTLARRGAQETGDAPPEGTRKGNDYPVDF